MIEIGNILLRKLENKDANSLAKHANDYDIWLNLTDSFPHPYSLENAKDFIKHCTETNDLHLCIEIDNQCVGMVALLFKTGIYQKTATIGYWIGKQYRGNGYMTKIVKEMCAYGFQQFDIQRIQTSVLGWNKASARVLEKAGFTLEGVGRKAYFKNNLFTDEIRFGLIQSDVGK